ncbi:hypothetical protein D3C81_2295020 [compost metagenome]
MPTVSELLSLSTIRHPINDLALNASELMIQSIEAAGEPVQPVDRMFPIELMARHTS